MMVHWTLRAKLRLKYIHDYVAKDAPLAASQLVNRLLHRSVQLGKLPYSGREVPEYQDPNVREVSERPYRILYRIKTDRIDIISVMHFRQLLPDDLTNL